ncbi:MAG: transposase [Dehalococcoidia bacterium]
MARDPRLLYGESRLVEITSRTIQGRYLTQPSAEANKRILGVLGRAQRLYGVKLHAFVFLSNHFHILLSILSLFQLSSFCRHFKGNVSKELGELYDWTGPLWARRYSHIELANTVDDQINRFLYILDNSCKEGLVASPLEWEGVSSARALYNGKTDIEATWYNRTAMYRAKLHGRNERCETTETVRLSPLPFLQDSSPQAQQNFYQAKVHEIEQKTAQMHQENGTRPLGMDAIQRRDPHHRPKELKSSPAPKFHASNPEDYRALLDARKEKLAAYREAAARLKKGKTDVSFPEDCFPPPLPYVESKAPT